MEKKIGEGLKKVILMGIGAAAITVEKSQEMVDELVKKGELTVEQGKELNQELKRNVKKSMEEVSAAVKEKEAETEDLEGKVADMSPEELEKLKAAIKKAEEAKTEE